MKIKICLCVFLDKQLFFFLVILLSSFPYYVIAMATVLLNVTFGGASLKENRQLHTFNASKTLISLSLYIYLSSIFSLFFLVELKESSYLL